MASGRVSNGPGTDGPGAGRRGWAVPALVPLGLGAFLLTLAVALAFVVVPAQKKTPLDVDTTTVTDTVPGSVFVGSAFSANTPTERNRARPECRAEGEAKLPMTCFIDAGIEMYSQRHVTAVEPSDADRATLQAAQTLMRAGAGATTGVESLVTASIDRVTTDRESAYPVDEAVSTLSLLSSGNPAQDPAPTPFARNGLQYKFPFDLEKTNYPYFDANTFTTNPISFVEESELDGVPVYVMEQKLGPIDMWSSIRKHFGDAGGDPQNAERILASYRIRDLPASRWGLPGEANRIVDMRRFYTNTRMLYVNPQTGQIVDGKEDIHQFFAENQQQADAFWADKTAVARERSAPTRTAVQFAAGWNSETVSETAERVQGSLDTLNAFGRLVPAVLAVLGVLALGAGVVLGSRRRR